MTRTNIHFGEKKNELLTRVWDIFMKHGYENTTLALIIRELDVSKGAFYHYFPTKEACADAAIELFSRKWYEEIHARIQTNEPADARFKRLILACAGLFQRNEERLADINTPANAIFHLKLMASVVKTMAPLYADVIAQGVREKLFEARYPEETAQMVLTLSNFYFDADLFHWDPESMRTKILAFEELVTAALKAPSGTLAFLREQDENNKGGM